LREKIAGKKPILFTSDVGKDAESMKNAVEAMRNEYNLKIETDVRPAFEKFDSDGSGAIDKTELKKLCETLGNYLTDEQTDAALVDLDLDKSGDIDFNEFKRWYFTGMKSYNGTTRNMLSVGNKT